MVNGLVSQCIKDIFVCVDVFVGIYRFGFQSIKFKGKNIVFVILPLYLIKVKIYHQLLKIKLWLLLVYILLPFLKTLITNCSSTAVRESHLYRISVEMEMNSTQANK